MAGHKPHQSQMPGQGNMRSGASRMGVGGSAKSGKNPPARGPKGGNPRAPSSCPSNTKGGTR